MRKEEDYFENNLSLYVFDAAIVFLELAYDFSIDKDENLKTFAVWRALLRDWQYWFIRECGPVASGLLAVMVLIFLFALIFDFEELFGATPPDDPIVLTKEEIDQLKQAFKQ